MPSIHRSANNQPSTAPTIASTTAALAFLILAVATGAHAEVRCGHAYAKRQGSYLASADGGSCKGRIVGNGCVVGRFVVDQLYCWNDQDKIAPGHYHGPAIDFTVFTKKAGWTAVKVTNDRTYSVPGADVRELRVQGTLSYDCSDDCRSVSLSVPLPSGGSIGVGAQKCSSGCRKKKVVATIFEYADGTFTDREACQRPNDRTNVTRCGRDIPGKKGKKRVKPPVSVTVASGDWDEEYVDVALRSGSTSLAPETCGNGMPDHDDEECDNTHCGHGQYCTPLCQCASAAPFPEGAFVRTPAGHVYRSAGRSPVYLHTCAAQGVYPGCPSSFWNAPQTFVDAVLDIFPRPIDGALIRGPDARVYQMRCGAPAYVADCASVGGCSGLIDLDQMAVDRLMAAIPCDDGNACTRDTCSPQGCAHATEAACIAPIIGLLGLDED